MRSQKVELSTKIVKKKHIQNHAKLVKWFCDVGGYEKEWICYNHNMKTQV